MKKLLILAFFFSLTTLAIAQSNIQVNYGANGVPDFLNVCNEPDTVTVVIGVDGTDLNPRTNIEATAHLFPGMEFHSLLASSSAGVSLLSSVDKQNPIFSIPDLSFSGTTSVTVTFLMSAKCTVIDTLASNNDQLVRDEWEFDYQLTGATLEEFHFTDEYRDAIAQPFFIIEMDNSNPPGRVGDCFNRDITITNSGLNSFVDSLVYENIQGGGVMLKSVKVNGTVATFTKSVDVTGDTIISVDLVGDLFKGNMLGMGAGNGDIHFDPDENVIITEEYCIVNCVLGRSSLHSAKFGCDDMSCLSVSIDDFIPIGEGSATVDIVSDNSGQLAGYCQNGQITVTYTNQGLELDAGFGTMNGIEVGVGLGADLGLVDGNYSITAIEIAGVNIPVLEDVIAINNNALFATDPDGPGGFTDSDNDGYFDDLPIGESFDFVCDYDFQCVGAQSTENEGLNEFSSRISTQLFYHNACNELITRVEYGLLRPTNDNSSVKNTSTTDIYSEGGNFYINHVQTRSVRFFENNCGGNEEIVIYVDLPPGMITQVGDTYLKKNGATVNVNMISESINGIGQWELHFDGSDDTGDLNGKYELNLGFSADCDAAYGFSEFPVTFEFSCPGCGCDHFWYSDTIQGPFIHKLSPPCPDEPAIHCPAGLKTYNFKVERTTFGFEDKEYTTPINPLLANKAVAITCDSVEMDVQTIVGDTALSDSIGFLIEYGLLDDANTEDIFDFGWGVITINSGGQTYNYIVESADVVTTLIDTIKQIRVGSNCLQDLGLTLSTNDNVRFKGYFTLTDDGSYEDKFEDIPNFRASAFGKVSGVDEGCDNFGEIFTVAKVKTGFSYPTSTDSYPNGCDETVMDYNVIPIYKGFDLYFGDEYYPSDKIDSIVFDFDPSILDAFSVFKPSVSIPDHPVMGNAYFDVPPFSDFPDGHYVATFDTLDFVPTLNTVRAYSFSFRVTAIPNCGSEYSSANNDNFYQFEPTVYYKHRYYANNDRDPNCVEDVVIHKDEDLIYSNTPELNFTPISNPNYTILGDTASWTVKLCNVSSEAHAGSTWFSVENPDSTIEILSIRDVSDPGNIQDLAFTSYGSTGMNVFTFADALSKANGLTAENEYCNTIEIKGIPISCGRLSLDVNAGWDCVEPTDPTWTPEDHAPCNESIIPLSIFTRDPYLDANMFEQVTDEVDYCEPLTFTILLRNTDLGDALDIGTNIILPLSGATLVPGSVEVAYPSNAPFVAAIGDPVIVDTTTQGIVYRYDDFSNLHAGLDANGLPGIIPSAPDLTNEVKIRYQIQTDCDFISGDLGYFEFQGTKSCGSPTNLESGETFPINIGGVTNINRFYNIDVSPFDAILPNANSTLNFTVTNKSSSPSVSTEDLIIIKLPKNITYVNGSTQIVQPAGWNPGEPILTTDGSFQTLVWSLPDGLSFNEKAGFSFDVSAPDYACEISSVNLFKAIGIAQEFNCVSDGTTCNSYIYSSPKETRNVLLSVIHGDVVVSKLSFVSDCVNNANFETVTFNGNIHAYQNFSGNFKIEYYFDKNGNGSIDATDSLIQSNTINGPLTSGDNVTFAHSYDLGFDALCNVIFRADFTGTGADCPIIDEVLESPRLQNAGDDETYCLTEPTDINYDLGTNCNNNNYTYSWVTYPDSISVFLSDNTIKNPTISIPQAAVAQGEYHFVLETQRPVCGQSRDTFTLIISDNPTITADFIDGASVCPGFEKQLFAEGGSSYEWFEDGNATAFSTQDTVTVSPTENTVYRVFGSNEYGCKTEISLLVIADAEACTCDVPTIASIQKLSPTCGYSDGEIKIHLNEDESNYEYTWNPDIGVTNSIGNEKTGLLFGGYYVTVTFPGIDFCESIFPILLENENGPKAYAATENASCGANDGIATLYPEKYTYIWEDGPIGDSRNNLSGGNYFVTIVDPDNSSCSNVMQVIIGEDNDMEIYPIVVTKPDCGSNNGQVNIGVTGGSGNYSYLWNDGSVLSSRSDLESGIYSITVVDNTSSCQSEKVFNLTDNVAENAHITFPNGKELIACELFSNDNSIDFEVTYDAGFSAPADTIISNGLVDTDNGNLKIGNYCIQILDANGCAVTGDCFEIKANDPLSVNIEVKGACNDNGTISIHPMGNNNPYIIDWGHIAGNNNSSFIDGLVEGNYDFTITDNSGCQKSDTVQVGACPCTPPTITSVTTIATDCKTAEGSAEINMISDPTLFTYTWNPDEGQVYGSPNIRNSLPVGGYFVTVSEGNSGYCDEFTDFGISSFNGPEAVIDSQTKATCGGADGSVDLSPDGLVYTWPDATVSDQRSDLEAGTYYVTIHDVADVDCKNIIKVKIGSKVDFDVSHTVNVVPDCATPNGSVTINIANGTGSYQVIWNDGGSGMNRTDLMPGSYQITIVETAGNECQDTYTFVLNSNVPLATINLTDKKDISCFGENDGGLTYNLTYDAGFVNPEKIIITDGNVTYENNNLPAGEYCLVVYDGDDCVAGNYCFEIDEPEQLQLFATLDTICGEGGTVKLDVTGGNAPYIYDWADIAGTDNPGDRTFDDNGVYELVIIDQFDCILEEKSFTVPDCPLTDCDLFFGNSEEYTVDNLDCPQPTEVCIDILFSEITKYEIFVDGNSFVGVVNECSNTSGNAAITLSSDQNHELIVINNELHCVDTVTVITDCDPACTIFTASDLTIESVGCDEETVVCFDYLDLLEVGNYDISLDGQPFQGQTSYCVFDTIFFYPYNTIPSLGTAGPYTFEAWEVNGTPYTAQFADINELVASMNAVDPSGNWVLDEATFQIIGGDSNNSYSNLVVRQNSSGVSVTLSYSNYADFAGAAFSIPNGNHVLTLDDKNGCVDNINIIVDLGSLICSPTIFDTIQTDEKKEYCIDPTLLNLTGAMASINNVCEDLTTGAVEFSINSEGFCVNYLGLEPGLDTACIEICDENSVCDTLNFNILVIPGPSIIYDTIYIDEEVVYCPSLVDLPGTPTLFENFCPEQSNSSVFVDLDNENVCVNYDGLVEGTDTMCIRICDENDICDTSYLYVTVIPTVIEPVAYDDIDTTEINTSKVFDLSENDILNGVIDSLFFTTDPKYGKVTINPDYSITYKPNENICGVVDQFNYTICNSVGCDEATVNIYIDCQGKVFVYTALSPNGDGKNDLFTVGGIEDYPDAELLVYNRWGNRVFRAINYKNDWDGTWDNKNILPDGTYFYILKLNDEKKSELVGHIELYR